MSPKDQLLQVHKELTVIVDRKLKEIPEWAALKNIERAIDALSKIDQSTSKADESESYISNSYTNLALDALTRFGRPLSTPNVIEYISTIRVLSSDSERNKVNISSALSKDERLRSIPWRGGRAWWFAARPIPAEGEEVAQAT